MIIVYALTTCPWCQKVKVLLTEEGAVFNAIDVDTAVGVEQEQALAEVERLTGKRSFPVTIIKDKVIQGYKPEEIKEALENEA